MRPKFQRGRINNVVLRGVPLWVAGADYNCLYDYCKGLESYIEIGTAFGYSACVAGFAVTGDVYGIDPWAFKKAWMKTIGWRDPEEVVRANWAKVGHDPKRLHLYTHATPPLPQAISGTFDIGLIDGKHGPYEHVHGDFMALSPYIEKYLLIHDVEPPTRKDTSPRQVFDWAVKHDPSWEFEAIQGVMGVLKRV